MFMFRNAQQMPIPCPDPDPTHPLPSPDSPPCDPDWPPFNTLSLDTSPMDPVVAPVMEMTDIGS